ncbi:amino acid permease like protein [Zymoseptoria brevis]|uniref:Amino acid permease like protein n=1 Tax=Zymoseptoria brevis TaxID=1047168 RepID=A0A0F4GMN7_9PEZI|nr:amino acid permease like protein [Zymoseptoria brevis]
MAASSTHASRSQDDVELQQHATDGKAFAKPSTPTSDNDDAIDIAAGQWINSDADHRDMLRLGKQQEFKRNFGFLSALAFVSVYMATWEFVLVSLSVGFSNGGFAGLFWCFITTTVCYSSIVASLAEMESMAPTAGGQYHWVSEFAPPQYQRVLSYASGWMSTLGWLASVASSTFVVATQIEAMINVTMPDFTFRPWQYFLLMLGFTLITIVFNTWGAPWLPKLEVLCLWLHLAGFVIVLIPLWVLCEKNSASDVFLTFTDNSGYNNTGTAYLISQVYVMYSCLGSDSVVHISEEVANASIIVPRAMWWSYIVNTVLGFIMLITMLFCIGPLDLVLESSIPYLTLFNRTNSPSLSIFLNVILFLTIYAGNITALATCAREIFAFARDKGLPFSSFSARMNKTWNIPFNAVYLTSIAVVLLSLIQLGSTLAFNIVVSLSLLGLLSTYMISIGCVLLRRLRSQPLPPARWSLGRWGIAVNGFAFVYSGFVIVWSCFPPTLPIDTASANWAPAVWVGVIVVSVVFYVAYGKERYTAPVDFVEGRRKEGMGLQRSSS